jgi:hypothetical protein
MEHLGLIIAALSLVGLIYLGTVNHRLTTKRLKTVRRARNDALREIGELKKTQDFDRKVEAYNKAVLTWKYGDMTPAQRAKLVTIMRHQQARKKAGHG